MFHSLASGVDHINPSDTLLKAGTEINILLVLLSKSRAILFVYASLYVLCAIKSHLTQSFWGK